MRVMTVTNPALGCKPCQKMQFTSQAATSLTCSDCKIRIMTSGFFPILLTMVYLAGDDAKHLLQSRSFLHVQHVIMCLQPGPNQVLHRWVLDHGWSMVRSLHLRSSGSHLCHTPKAVPMPGVQGPKRQAHAPASVATELPGRRWFARHKNSEVH